ncbi:hypothetical protein AXF42_Ash007127 [Apostasia shenzhenica]|uniref:Rubisco accumulation factor 1, chloroplastic n=1 Tax=Apostasia shenzhenica TaxID=1088818 RepID=A0A2I0BF65_9ASPA|nr:hypothetical protein AXF42_Ash007127 [Apostasia shenzhenica]
MVLHNHKRPIYPSLPPMATAFLSSPKLPYDRFSGALPVPPVPSTHYRWRRRCLHPSPIKVASQPRIPSTPLAAPPGEFYQPFRPPPSPLPAKYRSLGLAERLDILRGRLGLWHEYGPLISSLSRDGFTPPTIEEITGISGVEQNSLSVAVQVRDSLLFSSFDPDLLAFFDAASGADLLYELRFLNASQRTAAARHVVEHQFDANEAQELARAIKDFPRRRGDDGWECFSADSPGDCLAYTDFRLSREWLAEADRLAVLEKAMEEVETEEARRRIKEEMDEGRKGGKEGEEMEKAARVSVPVVRLRYGEVAEATSVVLLPACRSTDGEEGMGAAPAWCKGEGEMGVVTADKEWRRWVVLPAWGPVAAVGKRGAGVVVEFGDGRLLPWRRERWGKDEAVLVVVDRMRVNVGREEEGYFLVGGGGEEGKELAVERGRKLLEMGKTQAIGALVLVVRPPKEEEDNQLADEDWD